MQDRERTELESVLRDIAHRVGVAATNDWVKEEIEQVANRLATSRSEETDYVRLLDFVMEEPNEAVSEIQCLRAVRDDLRAACEETIKVYESLAWHREKVALMQDRPIAADPPFIVMCRAAIDRANRLTG